MLFLLLGWVYGVWAQEAKVLVASPLEEPLRIDGRLDEAIWQKADAVTDFTQFEPVEGAEPTFPTEVRVVYGPDNIYVGARMYDDNPEGILRVLSRRDEINKADRFWFYVDSYFNRKTAFVFAVSAAGVLADGIVDDTRRRGFGPDVDFSWDAVWEAHVAVDEKGWTVEMRIPYSMLRFPERDEQIWGVNFRRQIARLGEEDFWVMVPRTESGFVTHFGELRGLYNVRPRRNVQFYPYTVSRLRRTPTRSDNISTAREFDVGFDVKYGLSTNVILDGTFNPDFGQVESDPAVLNLTTFEVFFPEKRPFFLEGTEIFNYSLGREGALLYTRRIGVEDSPIIGATKITGRSAGGLSFGILGATTGESFTPGRYYGVTRLKYDVDRYSQVGGMLTYFQRAEPGADKKQSLTAGTDWDLRFKENTYRLNGSVNLSQIRYFDGASTPDRGFALVGGFDKIRGDWTFYSGFRIYSDRFNPNDVGRLRENDYYHVGGGWGFIPNSGKPFGPFLRATIRQFNWWQWSYATRTYRGYNFMAFSNMTLRSLAEVRIRLSGNQIGGYDMRETRGLGPYRNAGRVSVNVEYDSDPRRAFRYNPEIRYGITGTGGRQFATGVDVNWDAATWLTLSPRLSYELNQNIEAWATNVAFRREDHTWYIGPPRTSPGNVAPEDWVALESDLTPLFTLVEPYDDEGTLFYRPVFADRDTRQLELSLRSNVLFSPNLSFQVYSQLFVAQGHYDTFKLLQTPDALAELPEYPYRHDFSLNSFILNVVLRWEFRPGSILYFVWSQNRRGYKAQRTAATSPYDQPVPEALWDTFSLVPTNVFLVKINYLFLR